MFDDLTAWAYTYTLPGRIKPKRFMRITTSPDEHASLVDAGIEIVQLVPITRLQEALDTIAILRLQAEGVLKASIPIPSNIAETGRTDRQIVDQTEELARYLLSNTGGYTLPPEMAVRYSDHERAQRAWKMACEIQEMITATDPNDAVSGLVGDVE